MLHTQTASGSPPASEDHAPLIVVRAKRSHRGHDVTSLLVGMCLAEQGIEQGAPARGHRTRQRHLHLPAMRISLTPRERTCHIRLVTCTYEHLCVATDHKAPHTRNRLPTRGSLR
jgi:hypothetical protein